MTKRVGFAAVAIPVLVAVIWWGTWPLAAVLAAASVLATRELFALAATQGVKPFSWTATVVAIAVPLGFCLASTVHDVALLLLAWWPFAMLAVVVWVLSAAVFFRLPTERPLAAVSVTLFAMLYVVILPSTLFYIRHSLWTERSWSGAAVVFLPLVVTWVCDSAAMFGGKMLGGPKLAPTVSPGKTRSGGACGVVGGMLAGTVYAYFLFPLAGVHVSLAAIALLSAALAVIGQIGDLAESLFKREAGVKDSSTLIPGHGGVLDRLDSLYFVLPVAAIGYHIIGVL